MNFLLSVFWKNQNWFGRVQSLLIGVLIVGFLYYKGMYGVYKNKEIDNLKSERELLNQLLEEQNQKLFDLNKKSQTLTRKLKEDSNQIEEKRKQDEEIINNSTITDKQRNSFISNYENR